MSAIEIPYTVEERPDTGLYNAKLGVWLFLASEVMLFGALFSTYVLLRVGAEAWEHGAEILNIPLGTVNTLILIASSVTMVMSWASLKIHNFAHYRLFMGLTLLCALAFLVIKGFEYGAKFEHHLFPSTSTYMAIYFTMTGLHGLHVVIGMGLMIWLMIRTNRREFGPNYYTPVELVGFYWHFVDLVWIYLFPLLYLVS